METIYVRDHGIVPGDEQMSSLKVERMLAGLRGKQETELVFEKGEYHFYPRYAKEILMYIPNHDEDTIKRVVFDLSDLTGVHLKGEGTDFIFHTDVLPFYMRGSKRVTIEGITVDYERPAYSEGRILLAEPQRMRFAVDKEKYPYVVRSGRVYFYGDNFSHEFYCGCLEFDQDTKAPVYGGHDIGFNGSDHDYAAVWTEPEAGVIQADLSKEGQAFPAASRVGNTVVFRHHPRNYPAFYIKECSDILLKNVSVYHSEAMGVIAEFTKNITLDEFRVTFSPKHERMFTASADATHFVYCSGLVHVTNCLMENQLDDPMNVHGIYQRISTVIGKRECILQLMEHQHLGVKIGDPGDRLQVIDNHTMLPVGTVTIDDMYWINKEYCYLRTREDFPDIREMFVVENMEYVPDVLVENSVFRNNRARGLLLTSAGKVVVRNNLFQTAGAAILIEGDSNFWFESGATKDVRIEGNVFRDCAYVTDWGKAPIQVSPGSGEYVEGERYHKKIEICGNRFECFDERVLKAKNVEHLIFKDNDIIKTVTYPPITGDQFVLEGIIEFSES